MIKHTDGNIMPLLDMILDSGIDCLDPIDPIAGMDIAKMKRDYGHRVALKGNVDCAHTLTFGSEADTVRETKEVIRKAAGGGGLILSSSNSIHSAVKPGNYLAMWNAIRMYGKYPHLAGHLGRRRHGKYVCLRTQSRPGLPVVQRLPCRLEPPTCKPSALQAQVEISDYTSEAP